MSTMIPNIWIVEIDLLEVRMNGQSASGNSTKSPPGVSQKYTTTVRTSILFLNVYIYRNLTLHVRVNMSTG